MECAIQICFTCNKNQSSSIEISSYASGNCGITLYEALSTVCPWILDFDGTPRQMCQSCIKQLRAAYKFYMQCKDAHEQFCNRANPLAPEQSSDHPLGAGETSNDNDELCSQKVTATHSSTGNDVEFLYEFHELEDSNPKTPIKSRPLEEIEPSIMCYYCDKKFLTLPGLRFHEKLSHKNLTAILVKAEVLTNTCKYCKEVFERKTELLHHQQVEHGKELANDLICMFCHKVFTRKNGLTRHLKCHPPPILQNAVKNCKRRFSKD